MRAAQPILLFVTASLVAILALPALAAPVTVGLRGTFTSVLDSMGTLPVGIVQGAEFSGSYALDADLFVLSPDGFTSGYSDVFEGYFSSVRFFLPGEGASITLRLGSEAFAFSVSLVRIYESHTYAAERGGDGAVVGWFETFRDEWAIFTEPLAAPGSSLGLSLVYESSSGYTTESRTASNELSPPPVVTSLDGQRGGGRVVLFDPSDTNSYRATGELTDVFVVPEPSTAMLLGLGLLGLSRGRRGERPVAAATPTSESDGASAESLVRTRPIDAQRLERPTPRCDGAFEVDDTACARTGER